MHTVIKIIRRYVCDIAHQERQTLTAFNKSVGIVWTQRTVQRQTVLMRWRRTAYNRLNFSLISNLKMEVMKT